MNRPLIDYDLVLVSEPMIKIGTSLGVMLNIVFPNWLTLILLIIVLVISGFQTTKKGLDLVKAARRATYGVSDVEAPETIPSEVSPILQKPVIGEASPLQRSPLQQIYWWERMRVPLHKWLVIVFTWCILVIATLLRGSKAHPSLIGIQHCGMWWWLILVIANLILLMVAYGYAFYLRWYNYYKTKNNYVYHDGDIRYTTKMALFLPIPFLIVGLVSAMIGNGGGIILSPIFLQLGLLHQVVAATIALLEVFISLFVIQLIIQVNYLFCRFDSIFHAWIHVMGVWVDVLLFGNNCCMYWKSDYSKGT